MRGAGGTEGGLMRFFIGLAMTAAGGYLFFNAVIITNNFSLGYQLYSFGGFSVTSGLVLVPFIFGVGIIFYNSKNILGWVLAIGSLVMLFFGVIASMNFRFRSMTAFDLMVILVLFIGGIGLFLSSFRSLKEL